MTETSSSPEQPVDVAAILEAVNSGGAGSFTLLAPLHGGESGQRVYELAGRDGRRYLLKCGSDKRAMENWRTAARAVTVLRGRGYPAPAHLLIGCVAPIGYVLQELLPGEPVRHFTEGLLPALLNLNSSQADGAREAQLAGTVWPTRPHAEGTDLSGSDLVAGWASRPHAEGTDLPGSDLVAGWPAPVIVPVLEGGEGFCLLEPLRRHSEETRELLTVLQAHAAAGLDETYRTDDIVHFDWSPGNLLATGDTITGVIDWEAVCGGDRSFDLVTALLYSYDDLLVREQLWQVVLTLVNPRIAAVYLAHMLLRQIDWSLRHHTAAEVAYWLRTARVVLADIAR